MKLKYLILPFVLLVSSCSFGSEAAKINIVQKSYETEYSQADAQLLQFDEIGTKEYTEALNQTLAQELDQSLVAFDTEAAQNKDTLIDGNKSIFQTMQDVKYNKNEFVSVVEEQYTYTGGAHGMTVRKGRNFDVRTERELSLGELFADEGWQEALNNYMQRLIEENPDEYKELWEQPVISENQDYYITDDDLVVFYQPYKLSYYARGFVEFPIRLSEISGFMQEDYYRLVPNAETE